MVARAFAEASGKTCSSTSARAAEGAEALGAFADAKVPVRTEAGVGVATGELCGCATVFFSAVAFSEFDFGSAADGFGAGGTSRRAGCLRALGCWTAAVAAEDDDSGRRPRIFGSAIIATITRSPATTGTT